MTDATAAAEVEPRAIDTEPVPPPAVPDAPASLGLGRQIFEELTAEGAPFYGIVTGPQPVTLAEPDWRDLYGDLDVFEAANRRALNGGDREFLDRVFETARTVVFAPPTKRAPAAA